MDVVLVRRWLVEEWLVAAGGSVVVVAAAEECCDLTRSSELEGV